MRSRPNSRRRTLESNRPSGQVLLGAPAHVLDGKPLATIQAVQPRKEIAKADCVPGARSRQSSRTALTSESLEIADRESAARTRLQRLRDIAVAGGFQGDRKRICRKSGVARPRADFVFFRPRFADSVSSHIANQYVVLTWVIPTSTEIGSLHAHLLKQLKLSRKNFTDLWGKAKAISRGVIFDAAVESCFRGISFRRGLRDAWCRSRLLHDRTAFFNPDRDLVNSLCLGIAEEGGFWFSELENSRRRKKPLLDQQSCELGRHWTNPDIPLWMMGRCALLKACKVLAPHVPWSPAILDERLRQTKLRALPRPCILDVHLSGDGKIEGYCASAECFAKRETLRDFSWTSELTMSFGKKDSFFISVRKR